MQAAREKSRQLESENNRMRELLNAYMHSDCGKLAHTLDWCDAYLCGDSTAHLDCAAPDSGSESEMEQYDMGMGS